MEVVGLMFQYFSNIVFDNFDFSSSLVTCKLVRATEKLF